MTKKTRTVLFSICVVVFLLVAPSIILYSEGYRVDFEKKRIVKTGAFYLQVLPKGVMVFINGKLVKRTSFLLGSAFIENLLPRKYLLEIKKPGYQSWQKNLEISQGQVTEARNVVLIPEDLKFELLDKDLEKFFFSPDEEKVVFKKEIAEDAKESWSLKLYESKRKVKSHLIDEREISEKEVLLLNLFWSPDSKRIVLETEIEGEKKYFLLDLRESPIVPKALDGLENIKSLSFHPTEEKILFFTKISEESLPSSKKNSLTLFERNIEEGKEKIVLENVAAYKIFGENIFWIETTGTLQKSDLSGKSQKISLKPLSLKENADYQIEVLSSRIFLRENEKLLIFDENSRRFEEIGNKIKSFHVSPDSKKLCFWNDFEIWVLFLKEERGQPEKAVGTRLFLTRFSKKIGKIFWYTSHYLIFNVGKEIKIIEIDDRDKIQIWNIADLKNPEVYFNQKDERLYILSEGSLFVSKKLL